VVLQRMTMDYDFGISPPSCRRETVLVSIVVVSIPVSEDASLFTLHAHGEIISAGVHACASLRHTILVFLHLHVEGRPRWFQL
jgi:hypothetical protein